MRGLYLIVLLVLCFGTEKAVYAQSFCFTPSSSANASVRLSSVQSRNGDESFCLRVYPHIIRRPDGTEGQTPERIEAAMEILQTDFNPHGISFDWNGEIDFIDADNEIVFYSIPTTDIYQVNNHQDGIDIYFYGDNNARPGGRADGVGERSAFYVAGTWTSQRQNLPVMLSKILSHEMGHVLFLWHTHHGTRNEGTPGECPELVNGSNSATCGDLVVDTPADPLIYFNNDLETCEWRGKGAFFDENNDPYDPDPSIIMAYTEPTCMSYFTPGQGVRMRAAIRTLQFLQDCIVPCEGACPKNLTIEENVTSGNTSEQSAEFSIVASNVIESDAIATYKAGNYVSFSSGFRAENGASLLAFIESCANEANQSFSGSSESTEGNSSSSESTFTLNDGSIKKTLETNVFPNPTTGELHIQLSDPSSVSKIALINALGQTLEIYDAQPNQVIDIVNFEPGLYQLQFVQNDGQIITKPVVKN